MVQSNLDTSKYLCVNQRSEKTDITNNNWIDHIPQRLYINIAGTDCDLSIALSSEDHVMDNVKKFGYLFGDQSNSHIDADALKNHVLNKKIKISHCIQNVFQKILKC